jgi:hypothetical protein
MFDVLVPIYSHLTRHIYLKNYLRMLDLIRICQLLVFFFQKYRSKKNINISINFEYTFENRCWNQKLITDSEYLVLTNHIADKLHSKSRQHKIIHQTLSFKYLTLFYCLFCKFLELHSMFIHNHTLFTR